MNIAQELSIVRDNIAEYGMTNITQLEYDAIYQQGRADQKKEDNEFFNFDKVIEIEKDKSYQQGKIYGAREFAEWLVYKGILGNRCIYNGEITDYGKVYLAEWQKGAE